MKFLKLAVLFFAFSTFAQEGLFPKVSWSDRLIIILNKEETHCLIWNNGSYGLIYDLATGNQVKEVSFSGYTSDDQFGVHVFDYKNDKAIIAGWDSSGLKQEHYFLWDEANDKFYSGDTFGPPMHGMIQAIIGDEVVYAFTIYKKDKKGYLDLDKPSHSFVQFYNWKTKKWREKKLELEYRAEIIHKNVLAFRDKNEMKYLDLKTLTFTNQTSSAYDNIYTYNEDGKVYAGIYNKGISKIALLDENTLKAGKFIKAPSSNTGDYYWGAMWNYHVKLIRTKNQELDSQDVDLVIKNKKTGEEKTQRITARSKAERQAIWDRWKESSKNKTNKVQEDLDKKYASQIAELKEWEINFPQLPAVYVHDYNNLKGRDISHLKMSKRLSLTYNSTVYAIGKLFECSESKVFLVMLRGPQGNSTESVYAILKTDKYGNRLQYQIIARSLSDSQGYSQLDEFTIRTAGTSNATIDVVEKSIDYTRKQNYKVFCNN